MSMKQWLGQIDQGIMNPNLSSNQLPLSVKIPVDIAITLFLTEIINVQFSFTDST